MFLQELAKLIRIFLLNPYNMYDESYWYIYIDYPNCLIFSLGWKFL